MLNTKQENLTKVKHLLSFIGLYKTLHMATPATSRILAPLEEEVAGIDLSATIYWTHSLAQRFREAKAHIKNTHTFYVPHPEDILVIKTDAAQSSPRIGHTIFAIKGKELRPVRFHSSKLKPGCRLWSPCELEAQAIAVAIESEYPLLREAKNPILLLPDSKPVQDAVSLIQQGKFSASARMNKFLTNINKVPITVKHLSSKFHLNEIADHQSRNPLSCSAVNYSIHRFISGLTETVVVDAAAKCASITKHQGVELLLPEAPQGVDAFLPGSAVHNTKQQPARCANIIQAQGVDLLLPEVRQGGDALLPGATAHTTQTKTNTGISGGNPANTYGCITHQ